MTIGAKRLTLALVLALALTACGQAPSPAAPAATTAPAPTTDTGAPTDTPAAAGLLPAPLLFISNENDIARLEMDGTTTTTVTDEQELIIDFTVAPAGDALAYLTIANGTRTTLIRANADGSGRTELARGVIRGLAIAPDGSMQAGVMFESAEADGAALPPGVWSFPADGSTPTLLIAATEPQSDGVNTTPGVHYQPLTWSPDGNRLLLGMSMNMGPDGPAGDIGSTGLTLYEANSGQVRELLPLGAEPLCVVPVWGRDGDSVLCANGAAIGPPTPPLWRLELASLTQQPIIPAGEPVDQALSPQELDDGIYVLVAESAAGLVQQFMPQRIAPDGTVSALLPQPIEAGYDGGLWAPDGSGLIVGRPTASANRTIVWQPLGSGAPGEPVELLNGSIGKLAWASR